MTKIIMLTLCLWIFWSRQAPNDWTYGGAFKTEKQCETGGVIPKSPLHTPVVIICLPAGLHPRDTGLF